MPYKNPEDQAAYRRRRFQELRNDPAFRRRNAKKAQRYREKHRSLVNQRAKFHAQKESTKAKLAARREAKVTFLREIKNQPCSDCKVRYPYYVMDFDHVRGKKKFTVNVAKSGLSFDALISEIEKCDVVCSNCHRERTHQRLITAPKS